MEHRDILPSERYSHSEPHIRSIGPPPERHADRVVAEMMRQLAAKHALFWPAIDKAMGDSKDGSPRAQRRMEERIKRAGAFGTQLTPGKRGKYELFFYDLTGWDARRDAEITTKDPIPEKPWIAAHITNLKSEGGGRHNLDLKSYTFLFVTHHALSRAAQRFDIRTPEDALTATYAILAAAVKLFEEKGQETWMEPPPEGWRTKLKTSIPTTVVLKRHEKRHALVAATIF